MAMKKKMKQTASLPGLPAETTQAMTPMGQGSSWEGMLDVVKRTVAPDASPDEFAVFVHTAKRAGLDPLARQVYCVSRWDRKAQMNKMTIQVSIDGMRLTAQRSNEYEGQTPATWCGPDGKWREVWLEQVPPRASRVGVWRKGFKEPLYAVALWDEYVQKIYDKETRAWRVTMMWASKPALMLSKVAEALALRRAFPMELSGIYATEEMSQADNEPVKASVEVHEVAQVPESTPDKEQKAMALIQQLTAAGWQVPANIAQKLPYLGSMKEAETNTFWDELTTAVSGYRDELTQAIKTQTENRKLTEKQKKFVDNMDAKSIPQLYDALNALKGAKDENHK